MKTISITAGGICALWSANLALFANDGSAALGFTILALGFFFVSELFK